MMKLISFVIPTHLPRMGGYGNGYVALPKDHPCYGLGYDQIHEKYDIDVHCGLTYSEMANEYHPENVQGMWIVGFDTLHFGDSMANWPDERSVMNEAESLKDQLMKIITVPATDTGQQ